MNQMVIDQARRLEKPGGHRADQHRRQYRTVTEHVTRRGWTNLDYFRSGNDVVVAGGNRLLRKSFGVNGVPTSFILDRHGKILLDWPPY